MRRPTRVGSTARVQRDETPWRCPRCGALADGEVGLGRCDNCEDAAWHAWLTAGAGRARPSALRNRRAAAESSVTLPMGDVVIRANTVAELR
jgi:hypothetical protein